MARPRRLRHKLMLGLALVVGSIALLLGGTLYGINAYLTTVKTTERKLYEIQQVSVLILTLSEAQQAAPSDLTTELNQFTDKTTQARVFADVYRKELATTVEHGLDPEGGFSESKLLDQLDDAFRRLNVALERMKQPSDRPLATVRDNPEVRAAYEESLRIAHQVRQEVIDDIGRSVRDSNGTLRQSVAIVVGATVTAAVLVLALLYYFRQWIYTPIKELQGGVQRVHAGDFDHPIRITSRDELEELADEFNALTARMSAIYKDLARQVNERSRQLVRSERMVSVGFLAAGVAHEINNPLASILFCSEALERRIQDVLAHAVASGGATAADAEVLTRYLAMVQQEALRCKDITQKLLDFSRTGDRKREPTDIGGLVKGVLEVARHLPNSRGRTITFNPDSYVVAPVNAQDLKSVILNLVVNALDSMEDGGSLTIRMRADEDAAEVAFTDTGCGMTPDVLQNIFEPFFTRSRTGKGTGLGLFISHQIVDQHGGQIEAASPGPGHGSTFTVRVPLHEVATHPLPLPPAADPEGTGTPVDPETILAFPGKKAA